MNSKELYQALSQLNDCQRRLEEARESYNDTLNGKELINEILAPLRLKRVAETLQTIEVLKDKLIDAHNEKRREEAITNNLFD